MEEEEQEQLNQEEQHQEETHIEDTNNVSEDIEGDASEPQTETTAKDVDSDVIVLQQQLDVSKEKYLRLYSDFENFRRRTAREKLELTKTAGKEIIVDLLPVIDDFDRAKKAYEEAETPDFDTLKDGFELIMNKLLKVLIKRDVKEMQAKGEPFDSDLHEAIAQIPASSEDMKGKVIDVIEKGYQIDEKVVRYAKVVIGS